MEKIDIKSCVGKRVLAKQVTSFDVRPIEISILEVSPSGEYVRIESDGAPCWMHVNDYEILEVLPTKRSHDMKQFEECKSALLGLADDFLSLAEKHGIHVRDKKP